jgi:hypothetical protein
MTEIWILLRGLEDLVVLGSILEEDLHLAPVVATTVEMTAIGPVIVRQETGAISAIVVASAGT